MHRLVWPWASEFLWEVWTSQSGQRHISQPLICHLPKTRSGEEMSKMMANLGKNYTDRI